MAQILDALRGRVEAILCDGYGSVGYTITAGRFHRVAPDLNGEQASAERRVRVVIGLRVPVEEGVNPLDGHALVYRPLAVAIEYARTRAGSDVAEGYDQLDGGATDDEIADRMSQDQHDIETALCWHEHWSGLDPYLAEIARDGAAETEFDGPVASLVLRFRTLTRETTPGSYSP